MVETDDGGRSLKIFLISLFSFLFILFTIILAIIFIGGSDFLFVRVGFFVMLALDVVWIILAQKIWKAKSLGVQYRVNLEGEELKFFLFGKKTCPQCQTKMERGKKVLDHGIGYFKSGTVDTETGYGQRYEAKIVYTCAHCNKTYNIKELINS